MKRKGFTLIELLAVIVILAIIALITVPLLIGIVDKAKIGALKDSAYGLIESADLYYAQNMGKLEGYTKIEIEDGKQTSDTTLAYKGKIDGNGIIIISKEGKVQLCLTNDNIYVKKEFDDTEITVEEMTSDVICSIPNEIDGDYSMSIEGSSSNYYDKETIDLKMEELQQSIEQNTNSINNLENDLATISTDLYTTSITKTVGPGSFTTIFSYTATEDITFTFLANVYFSSATDACNSGIWINDNQYHWFATGGGSGGYGQAHSYAVKISLKQNETLSIKALRQTSGIVDTTINSSIQF